MIVVAVVLSTSHTFQVCFSYIHLAECYGRNRAMAADAWKAHAALLLVQLNYGAYHVIAKLALTGGINQLVFCVLRDVVALTILGPLAYMKDK